MYGRPFPSNGSDFIAQVSHQLGRRANRRQLPSVPSSSMADLLRYFALSLAILLAVADKFVIPWRVLRWVLALLFLFLCGDMQIATNQWPFLEAGVWPILFAVFLLAFMLGHSVVHAILRRRFGSDRFSWWYPGFCLVFGLVPLLILGMMEAHLIRFVPRPESVGLGVPGSDGD